MVIYLCHPVHGEKFAISELEAAQDEKNGWKRGAIELPIQKKMEPAQPVVKRSYTKRNKR